MREPQRYVIYARGHRKPDINSRIYVPIFTDIAYAKTWLSFFLEGEEHILDGNAIHLGCGVRLNSEQLDRILACKDNSPITEVDERRILRFKHGTWEERQDKPRVDGVKRESEVIRERRPDRPAGYVTITELCIASGILPIHARAALRASGCIKPEWGWAFGPKEISAIKDIIGVK